MTADGGEDASGGWWVVYDSSCTVVFRCLRVLGTGWMVGEVGVVGVGLGARRQAERLTCCWSWQLGNVASWRPLDTLIRIASKKKKKKKKIICKNKYFPSFLSYMKLKVCN
ncbi:hypothetical protein VTI28DRAFT_7339 [Corynascus sepedonium]